MDNNPGGHILAVNGGSSSLKLALFRADPALKMEWSGHIQKIGSPESHFLLHDPTGKVLADDKMELNQQTFPDFIHSFQLQI